MVLKNNYLWHVNMRNNWPSKLIQIYLPGKSVSVLAPLTRTLGAVQYVITSFFSIFTSIFLIQKVLLFTRWIIWDSPSKLIKIYLPDKCVSVLSPLTQTLGAVQYVIVGITSFFSVASLLSCLKWCSTNEETDDCSRPSCIYTQKFSL